MSTATAVEISNDCSHSMSPALTNGEDVGNDEKEHSDLNSSEKLKLKLIKECLIDGTDGRYSNGCYKKSNRISVNSFLSTDATGINGDSTGLIKNNSKNCDTSGPDHVGVLSNKTELPDDSKMCHGVNLSSSKPNGDIQTGCDASVSATKQLLTSAGDDDTPSNSPSVQKLYHQIQKLEDLDRNLIDRLLILQGRLATGHVRQQLRMLVEHNHKLLSHKNGIDSKQLALSKSWNATLTPSADMHDTSLFSTSTLADYSAKAPPVVTMTDNTKAQVQKAASVMSMNLQNLADDIDSDATASSSGCETDDEDIITPKFRKDTSHLPQTACWRWFQDRAMVVSRWAWLHCQVSDLEHKIRLLGDYHRQLRCGKQQLTSASINNQTLEELSYRAARCHPLPVTRRHKLVSISDAPVVGVKGRKQVLVRCQCAHTLRQCALCAGHHNYFKSPEICTLPKNERLAQVDYSFHPVLSFRRDVETCIEMEDVVNSTDGKHSYTPTMKHLKKDRKQFDQQYPDGTRPGLNSDRQSLQIRNKLIKSKKVKYYPDGSLQEEETMWCPPKKRKYTKKNKNTGPRPANFNHSYSDNEISVDESSLSLSTPNVDLSRSAQAFKRNTHNYDINDIVIPYHIAASTRVEKLHYKEIDTPRWRELNLDGSNSVHDLSIRHSTSVPSTPMTPLTSSVNIQTINQYADCMSHITQSLETPSVSSSKSSTNSLQEFEFDEDLSDGAFAERHLKSEEVEKQRYLNFITTSRRRTHSTHQTSNQQKVVPHSAGSPTPADSCVIEMVGPSHKALTQTCSVSLSISHDSSLIKEEFPARKRSNSLAAGKVKRDASVDTCEVPYVSPWQQRMFPLAGDDLQALDPEWRAPKSDHCNEPSPTHWISKTTDSDDHSG